MKKVLIVSSILTLVACATTQVDPNVGLLDMSSSRLINNAAGGISTNMTAEIVHIQNTDSQEVIFEWSRMQREKLDIDQYIISLAPGNYRAMATCSDTLFYTVRAVKLIEVELKQEQYWWAKFDSSTGTEVFLPILPLELNIKGGESITPVNISAIGRKACEAVYGDKKVNMRAKSTRYTEDFLEKEQGNYTLYNFN
jgi:hypothetical protein